MVIQIDDAYRLMSAEIGIEPQTYSIFIIL